MKFRLPPLNTLRLFEAAGRHLNFKTAAQELAITPSAISHGIQALEDWLGAALFHRNGRVITLTAAGESYLPEVAEALRLITHAADQGASVETGAGPLHVSVTPAFASRIVLPRLHVFRERFPHVGITIDTNHRVVELSPDGADLAIRRGHGHWPGLSAELLLTETLVPVCSRSLLERLGDTRSPGTAPLIHMIGVSEDWQAWAGACGEAGIDCEKGLKVDSIEMTIEAAVQGLGVAIGRRPFIEAELGSGALVRFSDIEVVSKASYWLVAPPQAMQRTDVQAFRNWLVEELRLLRHQASDDPYPYAANVPPETT